MRLSYTLTKLKYKLRVLCNLVYRGGNANEVQCRKNRQVDPDYCRVVNRSIDLCLLGSRRVLLCLGKPGISPVINRIVQVLSDVCPV